MTKLLEQDVCRVLAALKERADEEVSAAEDCAVPLPTRIHFAHGIATGIKLATQAIDALKLY